MKRYIYIVFACISVLLMMFACTDDELGKKVEVVEGCPVKVKMKVASTPVEEIKTKTASSDLYILLFDNTGNRVETSPAYYNSISGKEGNITFETTSGSRTIYAITNLSVNNQAVTKDILDKVRTLSDLKQLTVQMAENSIGNLDGSFILSGFWTNSNTATTPATCIIGIDGSLLPASTMNGTDEHATEGDYEIKLKRLQSEINFNISTIHDADKFTLTSYQVINVPNQSLLVENGNNGTKSVFHTSEIKDLNAGGNSFSFFMFENKNEQISTSTDYNLREESETMKEQAHAKIIDDWKYAPEKSTYIVLKGHYKGNAQYDSSGNPVNSIPVEADVTYYIHLGYLGGNAGDFSSLRNKKYTYNVKISGVNNIILEVTAADRNNTPGAQGDVYFSTGENIITKDCHYGSTLLKFVKKDLVKEDIQIKILVKSNNTIGFEDMKDLNWLTFKKMTDTPNKAALYPGKQNVISAEEFVNELNEFVKNSASDDATCYYTCFINEYYPIDSDVKWKKYVNQPEDRIAQIICRQKTGNDSRVIDAAYIIRQHPILSFYNTDDNVNYAWGVEWTNEVTNTMDISGKAYEIGLPYGNPIVKNENTDNFNGRPNMLTEMGTSLSWYNENTTDYNTKLYEAYAACMQRNRDENGNGRIDNDEVKWYLPALFQYTDMSIGMNILPQEVQLYSDDDYNQKYTTGEKTYWMFKHFISNTSKKVFWAEEGGPYGDFDNREGIIFNNISVPNGERQYRCIRNLGAIDQFDDFATVSNNVINLKNVAPDALRNDKLASGELREHNERQSLSRPYLKFEVAESNVSSYVETGFIGEYSLVQENGFYYLYYDKDTRYYPIGKGTPGTYVWVGYTNRGGGGYSKIEASIGWATQNRQADKGSSICSTYSQNGDGFGWRLPNMRELLLMVKLGLVTEPVMSRTYYSFYMNDRAAIGDNVNSIGNLKDYSIYSPIDGKSRQGFAYTNFVFLIDPGNTEFKVRCVRDR